MQTRDIFKNIVFNPGVVRRYSTSYLYQPKSTNPYPFPQEIMEEYVNILKNAAIMEEHLNHNENYNGFVNGYNEIISALADYRYQHESLLFFLSRYIPKLNNIHLAGMVMASMLTLIERHPGSLLHEFLALHQIRNTLNFDQDKNSVTRANLTTQETTIYGKIRFIHDCLERNRIVLALNKIREGAPESSLEQCKAALIVLASYHLTTESCNGKVFDEKFHEMKNCRFLLALHEIKSFEDSDTLSDKTTKLSEIPKSAYIQTVALKEITGASLSQPKILGSHWADLFKRLYDVADTDDLMTKMTKSVLLTLNKSLPWFNTLAVAHCSNTNYADLYKALETAKFLPANAQPPGEALLFTNENNNAVTTEMEIDAPKTPVKKKRAPVAKGGVTLLSPLEGTPIEQWDGNVSESDSDDDNVYVAQNLTSVFEEKATLNQVTTFSEKNPEEKTEDNTQLIVDAVADQTTIVKDNEKLEQEDKEEIVADIDLAVTQELSNEVTTIVEDKLGEEVDKNIQTIVGLAEVQQKIAEDNEEQEHKEEIIADLNLVTTQESSDQVTTSVEEKREEETESNAQLIVNPVNVQQTIAENLNSVDTQSALNAVATTINQDVQSALNSQNSNQSNDDLKDAPKVEHFSLVFANDFIEQMTRYASNVATHDERAFALQNLVDKTLKFYKDATASGLIIEAISSKEMLDNPTASSSEKLKALHAILHCAMFASTSDVKDEIDEETKEKVATSHKYFRAANETLTQLRSLDCYEQYFSIENNSYEVLLQKLTQGIVKNSGCKFEWSACFYKTNSNTIEKQREYENIAKEVLRTLYYRNMEKNKSLSAQEKWLIVKAISEHEKTSGTSPFYNAIRFLVATDKNTSFEYSIGSSNAQTYEAEFCGKLLGKTPGVFANSVSDGELNEWFDMDRNSCLRNAKPTSGEDNEEDGDEDDTASVGSLATNGTTGTAATYNTKRSATVYSSDSINNRLNNSSNAFTQGYISNLSNKPELISDDMKVILKNFDVLYHNDLNNQDLVELLFKLFEQLRQKTNQKTSLSITASLLGLSNADADVPPQAFGYLKRYLGAKKDTITKKVIHPKYAYAIALYCVYLQRNLKDISELKTYAAQFVLDHFQYLYRYRETLNKVFTPKPKTEAETEQFLGEYVAPTMDISETAAINLIYPLWDKQLCKLENEDVRSMDSKAFEEFRTKVAKQVGLLPRDSKNQRIKFATRLGGPTSEEFPNGKSIGDRIVALRDGKAQAQPKPGAKT